MRHAAHNSCKSPLFASGVPLLTAQLGEGNCLGTGMMEVASDGIAVAAGSPAARMRDPQRGDDGRAAADTAPAGGPGAAADRYRAALADAGRRYGRFRSRGRQLSDFELRRALFWERQGKPDGLGNLIFPGDEDWLASGGPLIDEVFYAERLA